jgi:hypothetical protein
MVVGFRFEVRAHPFLLILVPCCCLDSGMDYSCCRDVLHLAGRLGWMGYDRRHEEMSYV